MADDNSGSSSEGINKLSEVLQGRMHGVNTKPPFLDIGVIQGDMSLLTNNFPVPIPQKDYLVCRSMQWRNAGDRVLVAWVGDDACVVDIVYPATRIG